MFFTLGRRTGAVSGIALPFRRRRPNGKRLYKFLPEAQCLMFLNRRFSPQLLRMALALRLDFPTGFSPHPHHMNNFRRYASLIAQPQTD
jgi:hypothetical protein